MSILVKSAQGPLHPAFRYAHFDLYAWGYPFYKALVYAHLACMPGTFPCIQPAVIYALFSHECLELYPNPWCQLILGWVDYPFHHGQTLIYAQFNCDCLGLPPPPSNDICPFWPWVPWIIPSTESWFILILACMPGIVSPPPSPDINYAHFDCECLGLPNPPSPDKCLQGPGICPFWPVCHGLSLSSSLDIYYFTLSVPGVIISPEQW